MGRGRDMGRGSAESSLRGMSSGGVQENQFWISLSDICAMCSRSLAYTSYLILGQWDNRIYWRATPPPLPS